jgi:hypothetical protein
MFRFPRFATSANSRPPDLLRRPLALKACGICRRSFGPDLKATDDHVLPKGFFSKPVPDNLPTWRVCERCQDALDPAEERLRNLFVRGPTHDEPATREVYDRAQRSGRSVVPEKWDWVLNNMDLYEYAPIARAAQDDLDLVFSKVVGGLFYWKHGSLRPDVPLVVRGALSRDDFTYWTRVVQFDLKLAVQRLGQVVWVSQSDPDLRAGFWLFVLHDALGVGVWAGEMARRNDLPRSCAFPVRL